MKSRFLLLMVVSAMVMVLLTTACQGQAPAAGPAGSTQPQEKATVVLKAASAWIKEHQINRTLFYLADRVKEQSNGEIQIEWVGGPELVKSAAALDALSRGEFDILVSAPGYYEGAVPEGSITNAPLGVPYEKQLDLGTRTLPIVDQAYQKKSNTKFLLPFWVGYHLAETNKPVRVQSDFKGVRIRGGGGFYGLPYQALGASETKIASEEVYLAAQRGVIDARAGNPSSFLDYKEYEVFKYIIDYPTAPSTGDIWMNLDKWNKLPANLKDALAKSVDAAMKWSYSDGQAGYGQNMKTLQEKGMQIIQPAPDEAAKWTQIIREAAKKRMLEVAPDAGPQLLAIADELVK